MANVITQDDLNNNRAPGQEQVQQAGQGPQGSNQAGQPTLSSSQAPTITSYNPNTQRGTGYTNIQRIVQANTGNRLGQTVGSGIQQAGKQVQQGLGQAQQNFQQQTQANQFNTPENQALIQQGLTDPTSLNAQQQQQFQNLVSGQYRGPSGLQNIGQLQGQAQDVGQQSQALQTAGGRMGLLQRYVGTPQYTSGQQNLDALLLGQQGNQLNAARRAAIGLLPKITGAETGAEAQAQQSANQAQAFGQNTQQQLGTTVTGQTKALADQATAAQAARDAQFKQLQSDIASGKITSEEAAVLGATPDQGTIYGTAKTLQGLVQENPLQANAQNIATAQDYARLQALQQLGGQYLTPEAQAALQPFSNQQTLAGTFAASPYTTQTDPAKAQFQDIQKQAQAALEQQKPIQTNIEQLKPAKSLLSGVINPDQLNDYLSTQQGKQNLENLYKSTTSINSGAIVTGMPTEYLKMTPEQQKQFLTNFVNSSNQTPNVMTYDTPYTVKQQVGQQILQQTSPDVWKQLQGTGLRLTPGTVQAPDAYSSLYNSDQQRLAALQKAFSEKYGTPISILQPGDTKYTGK